MTGGQFKRPPVKSQKQLDQQAWFRAVNRLWSYLPATEIDLYQRATAGTPWMPRDWFVKLTARVAWALQEEDGSILYPTGWIERISKLIDLLGTPSPAFLVRAPTLWQTLPVGVVNSTLTSQGPGVVPTWDPNPFVSDLVPPSLLTFPNETGNATSNLAQIVGGPLDFRLTPPFTGRGYAAHVRDLKDPPATYTAKIRFALNHENQDYAAGLIVHGENDEFRIFGTGNLRLTGLQRLQVRYFRADGFVFANLLLAGYARADHLWLRILDDGINFTYQISLGGAAWTTVATELRDAVIGVPTTIGIALSRQVTSGAAVANLSVEHWSTE